MKETHEQMSPCPSCERLSMGKHFCSACGEQRLSDENRSLRHLLSDYIENLTSFDSKIWRSLKLLLFSPGQLDAHYHQGRRVNYVKPITLFLLLNVLFILFSPISDYYISLYDQLHLQPYSPWVQNHFQYFLDQSAHSYSAYEALYNQTVTLLSRSTIIIQALFFFAFVAIINHRKGHYPSDHMVFALNFHSGLMAWILILMVVVKVLLWLVGLFSYELYFSQVYYPLLRIWGAVYALLAVRKMYPGPWWRVLIQAALVVLAFRICHILYRLTQFYLAHAMT